MMIKYGISHPYKVITLFLDHKNKYITNNKNNNNNNKRKEKRFINKNKI